MVNQFRWKNFGPAILCLMVIAGPAIVRPPAAHAVPLPGFTGYSDMGVAIVNYAVLSPFDSFSGLLSAAYVPASGSQAFDSSKYTYLYQVAAPMTSTVTWGSLEPERTHVQAVSASSVGAFASGTLRLDFLNGGSIVNATGNNLQGASSLGLAARSVSGPERIDVLSNPAFSGSRSHPYWTMQGIGPGFTGPLVGYQSHIAPSFTDGLLSGIIFKDPIGDSLFLSGNVSVPNAVSASAPEPSTALLIGSGLFGMVAWRRRRSLPLQGE